jgi:PhoH-like ATPase
MRDRSLTGCVVVIDEAGNVYQIDNLSLSETTNGFAQLVDKFKSEPLAAHVELTKCERSELAARAAELL